MNFPIVDFTPFTFFFLHIYTFSTLLFPKSFPTYLFFQTKMKKTGRESDREKTEVKERFPACMQHVRSAAEDNADHVIKTKITITVIKK